MDQSSAVWDVGAAAQVGVEGALWTGRWSSELKLGVARVLGYLCRRTGGAALVRAHLHGLATCCEQIDSAEGGVRMMSFLPSNFPGMVPGLCEDPEAILGVSELGQWQ